MVTADVYAGCKLQMLAGNYDAALQSVKEKVASGRASASDVDCMGQAYFELGKFSLAAEQFINEAAMVTSDSDLSAAYQGVGMSMLYTGDYEKGIEYLEKKLAIDKRVGDRNEIGVSLATISAILGNMGRHQAAIDKSKEALNYLKYNTDISSTYNNIATEYAGMNDIDNAIKYMNQAIEIDRKLFGDKKDLAIHLINISDFYLSQKEDRKAIKNLNEGIEIIGKDGDLYWLMTGLSYRAKAYFYVGETIKSKADIDKTLKIAMDIKPREIDAIRALHASLNEAIGNSSKKNQQAQ